MAPALLIVRSGHNNPCSRLILALTQPFIGAFDSLSVMGFLTSGHFLLFHLALLCLDESEINLSGEISCCKT